VVVDCDQTGLIANGKTFELAEKGYFPKKKNQRGYQLAAAFTGEHSETVSMFLDSGSTHCSEHYKDLLVSILAKYDEALKDGNLILRTDSGFGSSESVEQLCAIPKLKFVTKGYSTVNAANIAKGIDYSEYTQADKAAWVYELPENKGLRNIIILACVINFFAQVGFVLLMPYFNSTPGLDAKKYGLAMGIFTLGMISGMLTLSIIKIAPKNKFFIFVSSGIISMAMIMIAPITENIYAICILLFIAGALNAVLNTLLNTTAQLIVPQDMRGKVFALIGTFTQALSPIGMVIGGVLGGILGAKQVISGSFGATLLFIICFAFMKSVKKVINYDPEKQTIEEIM
jgi:hypothetical protein